MKDLLHAAEPNLERQRHMIREHERPGARAAFAPIDGDEIDAAGAGRHQLPRGRSRRWRRRPPP